MDELSTELCILQSHLDTLVDRIRQNQIKLHRFQALEMLLLSLNSLRELVERVLEDTRGTFDLDAVTFVLIDEKGELECFLRDDGLDTETIPNLILLSGSEPLERIFRKAIKPYLGPYRPEQCANLLAPPDAISPSVALLPLYRRGRLLGSLNLVSAEPTRFSEQMATDFLDRLSGVLSVCLENTLNFELLRRTSLVDTLTGVNNRRYFEQRLSEEIDRSLRTGECLSCLFVDIDHFKAVNDTQGHQTGDRILVEVAQTVRSLLRNNDVLARYGGEEFVILLANTSGRIAVEVAERIRQHTADRDFAGKDENPLTVRLSIGVATLDPAHIGGSDDRAAMRLIEAADSALYVAKNSGRDRVANGGFVKGDLPAPQYAARY